jgi:dihydroneopterin aldolase
MDKIFLDELKIDTIIGIWDWERKIRQTVVIDLEMSADIAKAAATDDVVDTLNYKAVAKRLQAFVGDSSFQLVETLAENIARIIRDEFDVAWVRVKVHKPGAIRGSKDVRPMAIVYVGLGSNIDPEANLHVGVRELRARYGELQLSAVYRSRAVGFEPRGQLRNRFFTGGGLRGDRAYSHACRPRPQ